MAKRNGCPLCGNAVSAEFTPFCSRGCKDRDLLNWLGEGYRVPGESADPQTQTGVDSANDAD